MATRILMLTEVELIYSRSKVYLHPSKHKADNIPGFLTLQKGPNCTNKDIKLVFVPESQLLGKQLQTYEAVDLAGYQERSTERKALTKNIIPKPQELVLSGYCFSIALSYIYSIQVRKPSPGFWHGSIVVNTKDGEKLPIMFFHDSESPLHKKQEKIRNQNMDPFTEDGDVIWGGSDFMAAVKKCINVEKSTLEPSTYLVNPDLADLRNFSPLPAKKEPDAIKLPDLGKFLATTKWKVLETVATLTARTKTHVMDMVEDHAPPQIKQVIAKPEVQRIGDEFDSARVYLAKWAQQVKEEAEKSLKQFILDYDVYSKINKELGSSELLTQEEINATSRRNEISQEEWASFFDYSGRLSLTVEEVKSRIFHGGLHDSVRKEAWLFLLEVYPWTSSREEREVLFKSYESAYHDLKLRWVGDDAKRATDFWIDQKHRIEKDINRTDRHLDIFKNAKKKATKDAEGEPSGEPSGEGSGGSGEVSGEGSRGSGEVSGEGPGSSGEASGEALSRPSSPETPDEDDEFDISNIQNPHLYRMREILLTYNEHNVNLGYVQGMTDLLSPLYVKFQDEVLTFWAFSKFMERMERNYVRDQSGMKLQMSTLNKLLQFMLPDLYKHLEKCESVDLFFFFRMLLVWFKREMEWDQVMRLWEILWTDYYSSQYHLFVALAVLSDNERIIIQNLRQFDEVLKYMNDLSMKLHLEPLLIRSELLFLKFKRMIDIIDRENSIVAGGRAQSGGVLSTGQKVEVGDELRTLLSKKIVIQKEVERPEGVGGG